MTKRILCIITSLNRGGAETFMMKLYRSFDKEKYQMDFVTHEEGEYVPEILSLGGKVHYIPPRTQHPIKSFTALKRIVKENNYTYVLKLGDPPISVVDLIAAKLGGAKTLAMRSCNALVNRSPKQKILDGIFRFILNRVTNVKLAPSDLAANYTFGKKEVERGNVTILHNAVDLSVFRFDEKSRTSIRQEFALEDSLVIGHVGRMMKQKNHKFLLEVFAEIKPLCPKAKLLLVGNGELHDEVMAQVCELGLTNDVIFTGVRSDIPAVLSAMDVLVLPSFHEGMPNVVIEAQATGLTCVISDTITRSANITGLVTYLPLGDARFWAENALAGIKTDRPNTKQMFLDNQYDIESISELFLNLICGEDI